MSLRARFQPAPSAPGQLTDDAESHAAAMLARMRGRGRAPPAPKAAKAAASVLRPLLGKSGGVGFSELRRRWAELVGEPFASKAVPHGFAGGVLTLHAAGSIAPFLLHQTDLIMERLRLAGVKVSAVRIEQRAMTAKPGGNVRRLKGALPAGEETALAQQLDRIGDPSLKSALMRLGRAVKLS
jgi:hypothetical protein